MLHQTVTQTKRLLQRTATAFWLLKKLKRIPNYETIALYGTRCVIFNIQTWSFTGVNSRRLQSQYLAITAFCKAPPKDKFYLSFWRPSDGLFMGLCKPLSA